MTSSAEYSLTELWRQLLPALEHVITAVLDPETRMPALAVRTEQLCGASVELHALVCALRDRGVTRVDSAFADQMFAPLAAALMEESRPAEPEVPAPVGVGMVGGQVRSSPFRNAGGMQFVGADEKSVLEAAAQWFGRSPDKIVLAMTWHYSDAPEDRGMSTLTVFTDTP